MSVSNDIDKAMKEMAEKLEEGIYGPENTTWSSGPVLCDPDGPGNFTSIDIVATKVGPWLVDGTPDGGVVVTLTDDVDPIEYHINAEKVHKFLNSIADVVIEGKADDKA